MKMKMMRTMNPTSADDEIEIVAKSVGVDTVHNGAPMATLGELKVRTLTLSSQRATILVVPYILI